MTTIVSVRRNGHVVIAGDGQATLGNTVMKGNVKKVRRLYNDKVIAGFAGGTADAFTLFELFERKLEMHQGHLVKAAVELAKDWRTDRMLRKLEALLAVADENASLIITGNGDVVQPENDLIAIGSGGLTPRPRPARCWKIPIWARATSPRKRWILQVISASIPTISTPSKNYLLKRKDLPCLK